MVTALGGGRQLVQAAFEHLAADGQGHAATAGNLLHFGDELLLSK
jgi:hypothetical protein